MNSSITLGLFLALLGLSSAAWSDTSSRAGSSGDLGVGIEMGQPMGGTAKYWLSNSMAVDAAAGYHFSGNFDTHADLLLHAFPNFNISQGRMPIYIGMGARILAGDDTQFGFRWPLGLSYLFPSDPIEAFAEIAPILKLNGVGFDMDGAVGIRFYFKYLK